MSNTRKRQGSAKGRSWRYLVKRPLAAFLATLGVGMGVALGLTVSNILTFGPVTITSEDVKLDVNTNLPASLSVNTKATIKFNITAVKAAADATLKMKIKSDPAQSLTASMATVSYKAPGGAFTPVTMTTAAVAGGTVLVANLKTGWAINEGFTGTGEAEITFNTGTPSAAYSIDLWIETGAAAPGGGGATGTSYTLGVGSAAGNKITYKSGTPPDGSAPPAVDSNISTDLWFPVFKAGETGTLNFVRGAGSHNMSLYPSTSLCATDIAATDCTDAVSTPVAADIRVATPTGAFTFTPAAATTTGTEYHLVCNLHSDTMRTKVKVVP